MSCADGDTVDELCRIIREQCHDMLCINDPEKPVDFEVLSARLRGAFEMILPEKSEFER